jgi:selenocysteine-specific elongation factor
MYLAATSCSARITGTRRLKPDQTAIVVVETDMPVVATFRQKCLFRLPYPVSTIGGGTVLATFDHTTRRSRRLVEWGEKIALANPVERLVAWIEFLGEVEPEPAWCELQVGLSPDIRDDVIKEAVVSGNVVEVPNSRRLAAASTVQRIQQSILTRLEAQAANVRDAWIVEESVIRQTSELGSEELIRRALQSLIDEKRLVRVGSRLAIASDENVLSKKQLERMQQIETLFHNNRSPPSAKEIAAELNLTVETVVSLSRFAVQTSSLLDCGDGLLLSATTFRELCRELRDLFAVNPELTVADIRDHWQVTRKHAIPFLEFCDRINVTSRTNNVRTAGVKLSEYAG